MNLCSFLPWFRLTRSFFCRILQFSHKLEVHFHGFFFIAVPVQVKKERQRKEKVEETKAKKNIKPRKEKTVPKQDNKEGDPPKNSEPDTRRIEVMPAKSDDSFWDFYEKPFPQS